MPDFYNFCKYSFIFRTHDNILTICLYSFVLYMHWRIGISQVLKISTFLQYLALIVVHTVQLSRIRNCICFLFFMIQSSVFISLYLTNLVCNVYLIYPLKPILSKQQRYFYSRSLVTDVPFDGDNSLSIRQVQLLI